MTRGEFAAWCAGDVRLLDGATGTNLYRAGMPRGVCAEAWVLEHPQVLLALQRAYAQAGSQIVYASTFGANRRALAQWGLEDRLEEMNRALVTLSREAVGQRVLVAGDMTTLGHPVEEAGAYGYAALLEVYREQVEALAEGGVDLFVVETMMGMTETLAAVEAIRSVSDLPILCTLSVQADGKCYFDGTAVEAAAGLEALGADAVGINCAAGPQQIENTLRRMGEACSLPLAAKPNAGLPRMTDAGEAIYPLPPAEFAGQMVALRDAGARLLGGCCGTDPEYIRALRTQLEAQ